MFIASRLNRRPKFLWATAAFRSRTSENNYLSRSMRCLCADSNSFYSSHSFYNSGDLSHKLAGVEA
jgi:hypothetical protein